PAGPSRKGFLGNDIRERVDGTMLGPARPLSLRGALAAGVRRSRSPAAEPAGRSLTWRARRQDCPKNNGCNFAVEVALPLVRPHVDRGQRGDRYRDPLVNSAA